MAQPATEDLLDSLWIAGEYQQLVQRANELAPLSHTGAIRKAEALTALADYGAAKTLLSQVAKEIQTADQAGFETALAYFELTSGRSDLALQRLETAWDIHQRAGTAATRAAARTLGLLSTTLNSLGKYNEAIRVAEQALAIRQNLPRLSKEELAASFNDLGLVYSKVDPDKALTYYDQALPLYASLHGNIHPKIAIINTNMGYVYNDLKLYGDAITNFETALAIWQKIYPQGHPNEAFVRLNLGRTYGKLNNLAATKGYYRQALALYQKVYGTAHPDIASTFNQLGSVFLTESKYDSALYCFQQALASNSIGFAASDVSRFPDISEYYNGQVLLFSLHKKSKTLEERYYGKTLGPKDLTSALKGLLLCDSLIDRLRQQTENENDKLAISSLANEVYQDGVRVAKTLSEVTTQNRRYRELCFYFAEKSKSAVLQEAIADAQAKSFAGIPETLLEREKELKAAIVLLSQEIQNKPDPTTEATLRQQLFASHEAYQDFIQQLETDYPAYYNLKFKRALPRVGDLQAQLAPQAAIVSYFIEDITQGNSRVYIFIISKKGFRVESRTLPTPVTRALIGFNNSLYFTDAAVFQETGRLLNQWLRPHLPKAVREVTIIPDSQLGTLPFEALPTSRRIKSFADARYWADAFAISYQFSVGLMGTPAPTTTTPSIYLCAPVDFEKSGLASLPATAEEVQAIATLFDGRAQTDLRSNATEARVKSEALREFEYIHFATHGVVDAREPERSRLFLAPSETEDGFLYSGEIYNLELNAKLAVLSACQTGLGKVSKGEGVIGLSRALVYAGAQNLVVSFWSVADQSTMQLMRFFYEHVKENPQASFRSSLQAAKLKLRQMSNYATPYYWAPFVLIGS